MGLPQRFSATAVRRYASPDAEAGFVSAALLTLGLNAATHVERLQVCCGRGGVMCAVYVLYCALCVGLGLDSATPVA